MFSRDFDRQADREQEKERIRDCYANSKMR